EELLLVFEVGAGRVAERVAAPLISLREEAADVVGVAVGNAKLDAGGAVPVLRKRLGALHPQTVEVEVVGVAAGVEKSLRVGRRARPHGHYLRPHRVELPAGGGAEEVGKAEVASVALAREGEALPLHKLVGAPLLSSVGAPLPNEPPLVESG